MSKATVTLGTLATAIGIAGVVVGSIALVKVDSMPLGSSVPSTATVTPEPSPASDVDVRDAAVETCAAFKTFRAALGAVRQPHIDAVKAGADSNSADFIAIEGRYFGGAAAELSFLMAHVSPATPPSIADAVDDLYDAATVLVDADVRSERGEVSNQALFKVRDADRAVEAACAEAGVGR
jgi:hypothetical protein